MTPFTSPRSLRRFEVQRDLAVLVVLVAACAFPFLGQPFHMDDNFYLDMARNARVRPLYPNDTPYVFEGRALVDMGSHSHPPLQTYLLAVVGLWAGDREGGEWRYHLAAMVFPLLAVVSLYFLSARFLERPVWPAAALAVAPVFVVMQHTLMTDLPSLALGLAAIACFVWASERRSAMLYAASALCLCAALLASYLSFSIVVLLAYWQWRRGRGRAGWVALAAAAAFIAVWLVLGYFHYHRFLLVDTAGYVGSRRPLELEQLGKKLGALLGYQGWLVVFPPFLVYVVGRGLRGRLAALAGLAALYVAAAVVADYTLAQRGIFVVGIAVGGLVAGRIAAMGLAAARPGRETVYGFARLDAEFLALWYFGVASYCLVLLTEGSARYILPLVPPLLVVFFRGLEVLEVVEYRRPRLIGSAAAASGAIVVTLAWGLALAHADAEFARIYPRAARDAARARGDLPGYFGGEWGFRYYFQQAGFALLPQDETEIRGGSLVASPRLALPYPASQGLQSMLQPFATFTYQPATPLRLLDAPSHAGFYSTGWGLLPFSVSRKAVEIVELRQVNFLIERLPWAAIEAASGEEPWPGFVSVDGRAPLGLVVRPGSRVVYRFAPHAPLRFEASCAVSPDAYREGDTVRFEFEVRQRDARGGPLAEKRVTLEPGVRKEDRSWRTVELDLVSRDAGGSTLELGYTAYGGAGGIGVFASSNLRSAR